MMNWIANNKDWVFSGIGILLISGVIATFRYTKKKISIKKFVWEPKTPMRNSEAKDISTHPKDIAFDIEIGDIQLDRYVSGVDALVQSLQKFVLTERCKYPIYGEDYGTDESVSIFVEKNQIEFQRQCYNIALHLMDYFKDWVEEIYQISRKNNHLIIELKVAGKPDTVRCKIPNKHNVKGDKN